MSNPQGDAYKKAGITGALTPASYPGSFKGLDLPERTPAQKAAAAVAAAKEEAEYQAANKPADGGRRRRGGKTAGRRHRGRKTAKAAKKTAGRGRRHTTSRR